MGQSLKEVDIESENYLSLQEFHDIGLLQEINRQLLHPLGLAMIIEEDKDIKILDFRFISNGITYNKVDISKVHKVKSLQKERLKLRKKTLGSFLQPVDKKET